MNVLPNRSITIGQKVRVYVNLHQQGKFSIVDMKTGLVCAYSEDCLLQDAVFFVSESGQSKVRSSQHKMVHAWVRGVFVGADIPHPDHLKRKVRYDPYTLDGFTDSTGEIITYSTEAYCSNKKIYI